MKRIIWIVLLLAVFAVGRAEFASQQMRVCNCEEWVSLRAEPNTKSERLIKVPLGETVENCSPADDRFTYCEYEGRAGYILTEYLEPVYAQPFYDAQAYTSPVDGLTPDAMLADGGMVLLDDGADRVIACRYNAQAGELLLVGRFDASGSEAWAYSAFTSEITELNATEAFVAGSEWDRLVMIYNSHVGLAAIDAETGEIRWTLGNDVVHLGASITYAVDDFGTMYICGYYGPDPVAIGMDGTVLWQSDVEDSNVFWPYEIRVVEGGIITCYDSLSQTPANGHYEVFIGFGGKVEWISVRA